MSDRDARQTEQEGADWLQVCTGTALYVTLVLLALIVACRPMGGE